MKILGVIQCRTGSKRLPSKALLPLAGKPMIWRYIERVKRCKMLDEIVLATTWKDEDKVLCDIAEELGIKFFYGSENDLVDRIYKCAIKYNADVIVRLCADNPLIEPKEIDRIIKCHIEIPYLYDFSTNVDNWIGVNYPDGIGAEVYSIKLFKEMYQETTNREHPHRYAREKIDSMNIGWTTFMDNPHKGYANIPLTVDTQEDYKKVSAIYDKYGAEPHFTDYKEML